MIVDKIVNADKYTALHPLFGKAIDFLRKASEMPNGKYELEGENLYVFVSDNDLRAEGDMEAHRKYIDIQLVLSGNESFRCAPVDECRNVSKEYDDASDILFFSDDYSIEYKALEGTMSIFYPSDAHAPLIGNGMVRKAIAKVKLA